MAAGAQHMESGIHRGLVNIIKINTQNASPSSISITLDCKKISNWNIIEKSVNFKRNFRKERTLLRFNVIIFLLFLHVCFEDLDVSYCIFKLLINLHIVIVK